MANINKDINQLGIEKLILTNTLKAGIIKLTALLCETVEKYYPSF